MATHYGLGGTGDRIPVEASLFAPLQNGSEAHPTAYTMETWFFQGVKEQGRGVDHPPHLAPRLKKE